MIELTEKEKRILVEIINSVNIPGKAIEEVCIIKAKLMSMPVPQEIKEEVKEGESSG